MVERVRCERQPVYDIQVAGNSNFFANGILVHNCFIIDDPIKNAEQANSERERESMWEWWQATAKSRLQPGGSVVVLHQRWHMDDLIGRLKEHEGVLGSVGSTGEPGIWENLRMPAIADEAGDMIGREIGEALWPEMYDVPYFESYRQGNEYNFSALYQQNPVIKEGGYFSPHMFEIVDAAPVGTRWVRYWDLAGTEETKKSSDPDYTVGALVGLHGEDYYIEDVIRVREAPGKVESRIKDAALRDGFGPTVWIEQEPGSAGKYVISNFQRRVLPLHKVRGFKSTGPKEEYADMASARGHAGRIKLVRGPWNRQFIEECCGFPRWAHDDCVDVLSKGIAVHEQKTRWGVAK